MVDIDLGRERECFYLFFDLILSLFGDTNELLLAAMRAFSPHPLQFPSRSNPPSFKCLYNIFPAPTGTTEETGGV